MKILVDIGSRIVLMAGDNLTSDQINAQKSEWCTDYATYSFAIHDAALPLGFAPLHWTYSADGVWTVIPESQHIVDAIITSSQTAAVLVADNVTFNAVLKDDVTFVSALLTWNKVATATSYEIRYSAGTDTAVITVLDSGSATTSTRITGLLTDTEYSFNVRAQGQWGLTGWSGTVTKTSSSSLKNVVDLLYRINPDISTDKVAQFLRGDTGFVDMIETGNAYVAPGAFADGYVGNLSDVVYSFSKKAVIMTGQIDEQYSYLEVLKDRIVMRTNSFGRIAGLAMGWDDTNNTSEIVLEGDVLKFYISDEKVPLLAAGKINGVDTVGVHGDMALDGTFSARHMAANSLYIGTDPDGNPGKIHMGTGAVIQWSNLSAETQSNLVGPQGTQGPAGENGLHSYFHIAYATSAAGAGFSQNPSGKTYIGTYVDYTATDSNDPVAYSWKLFKGADGLNGSNGLPGTNGANGQTSYFHTAYATDGSGGGFSQDPSGKTYIGTYVDYTEADSSNPAAYTWVKFQGPQGVAGTNGTNTFMPSNIQESGGGLQLNANGFIKSAGKGVDGTGTGILYGVTLGGTPVLNVGQGAHGDASGHHISWNGSELEVIGNIDATTLNGMNVATMIQLLQSSLIPHPTNTFYIEWDGPSGCPTPTVTVDGSTPSTKTPVWTSGNYSDSPSSGSSKKWRKFVVASGQNVVVAFNGTVSKLQHYSKVASNLNTILSPGSPAGATGDLDGDGYITNFEVMVALGMGGSLSGSDLTKLDVAPTVNNVSAPDGLVNTGDAIVLLTRRAAGLVSDAVVQTSTSFLATGGYDTMVITYA